MPAPVGPATTRRRLDSLNKPTLARVKPRHPQKPVQQAKCCDDPKIEEDEGKRTCNNCYTVVSESNIVADVTFQEDSRGAATVQGGFIGENARHARTLGAGAFRRVGGSERNTFAEIENNGRRVLNALCPSLNISEIVQNQAASIWGLAAKNNFNAGRKTDEVVAACLYAACRRQRRNDKMMIDISEKVHANVFRLGKVYKDLCDCLFLGGDELGTQYQVEIEPLIEKYCRQLEFGDATRQVAEDAIKIIRRMNRDWMTTGRHPAGLCGACIILAARMNNFRRSVREVVWVAKVADATIAKRIEEFRRTKAAALTVEQFRQIGPRIRVQHDPPSMHEADIKKQKQEERMRKRQEAQDRVSASESRPPSATPDMTDAVMGVSSQTASQAKRQRSEDDTIEISDDESETSSPSPSASKRQKASPAAEESQQEPRFDADGFAIPPLPRAPSAEADGTTKKKKPGRQRKADLPPTPLPTYTEEELITEEQLEREIEQTFEENEVIREIAVELDTTTIEQRAQALSQSQKQHEAEQTAARRQAANYNWDASHPNHRREEVTAEELASEFDDDVEVNNCILTDEEAKRKEQIWLTFNEDWLRQQHEKELLKRMEEARGGKDKRKKAAAAAGKKRKKAKMGDGTLLNEAQTPIESPADAAKAMLDKHADANFSKFVDYDAIKRIFGERRSSSAASRAGSMAPTTVSQSEVGTPAPEDGGRQEETGEEARRKENEKAVTGTEEEEEQEEVPEDGPSPRNTWDEVGEDEEGRGVGGEDEEDYNDAIDEMGGASFGNYDDDYGTYGDDEEYD